MVEKLQIWLVNSNIRQIKSNCLFSHLLKQIDLALFTKLILGPFFELSSGKNVYKTSTNLIETP